MVQENKADKWPTTWTQPTLAQGVTFVGGGYRVTGNKVAVHLRVSMATVGIALTTYTLATGLPNSYGGYTSLIASAGFRVHLGLISNGGAITVTPQAANTNANGTIYITGEYFTS